MSAAFGTQKTQLGKMKAAALQSLLSTRRILQSPMAGAQGFELAAAVHNSGLGIGAIPCALLSVDQIVDEVRNFRQATNQRDLASPLLVNLNFFCHAEPAPANEVMVAWKQLLQPYYSHLGLDANKPHQTPPPRKPFGNEHLDILRTIRPAIVSFHFGLPKSDLLDFIKRDVGSIILSSATTVEEAKWLAEQGVDGIIAQGLEAGGHRGIFLSNDLATQLGTFALLPQIINLNLGIPIIAAGGINDAAGIQACQVLGASACQMGTTFLLSKEARTSPIYRKTLLDPSKYVTAVTNVFTGRPARGIVNRLVREVGPMSSKAPPFPLAAEAVFPLRAAGEAKGSSDFTSCWSGQNRSRFFSKPNVDGESALELVLEFASAWKSTSQSRL